MGWQPIETAPRDGTVINLLSNYGTEPNITMAAWQDETFAVTSKEGAWVGAWVKCNPQWIDFTSGYQWMDECSLKWRPLGFDMEESLALFEEAKKQITNRYSLTSNKVRDAGEK